MPKSPEGYQPSPREIKKAEDMMTPEQKKLSEERESIVGQIDERIDALTSKQAADSDKFYAEAGEDLSENHESDLRSAQEQEFSELSTQLAEEATKLYGSDPDKAREFALYAAKYFTSGSASAVEQLTKEMAKHNQSEEAVEIIKNLPTGDGDESSSKTNILLRIASSAEGEGRDKILAYVKSLLEPRITEDYRGEKVLDWHYKKRGGNYKESLDYKLVGELFGEEYALSLANQEAPDLSELSRMWEFHPYEGDGHDPRIYALYNILGPERFAEKVKDEISGDGFKDVVLAKKVFNSESGEWKTQAEITQQQEKGDQEYEKHYKGPRSFHLKEARERGLQNSLELYIEQGKRGFLASAIRFAGDRGGHVSFLREHYPDQVNPMETEVAISEGQDKLKSFRTEYLDTAIKNLSPNEKLDLRDALEALRGGDEDEKSKEVQKNVHDQLIHSSANNNVEELLYLLGVQQYRHPEAKAVEHTLESVSKLAEAEKIFDSKMSFYPGDGRPLVAGFHDIAPVKIKLGSGEKNGGVEVEVNGWEQTFHRGQLDHVVVRTTDGRQYHLWGKDADAVHRTPGFERAWTT